MSMNRRRLLLRHEYNKYIHFEDKEVERICIEKWDKDGDGKLSKEEAALITDIGTTFAGNKKIKSLNFLSFTNIKKIGYDNFVGCDSLESIIIPKSVEVIDWYTFGGWIHVPLKSIKSVFIEEGILKTPEGFDNYIKDIVDYPSTISTFGAYQPALQAKIAILRSKIPPKITITPVGVKSVIYVPDTSLQAYREAPMWKDLKYFIHPLSEYKGNY